MKTTNRLAPILKVYLLGALGALGLPAAQAQIVPQPIYQYEFTDYNNTGSNSGGTFSTWNSTGELPSEHKYDNGILNLSANIRANTYSSRWLRSDGNNAGTLNQFTISFWVKASDLNGYQTIFAAGSTPDMTSSTDNTFSIRLVNGKVHVTVNGSPSGHATTAFNAEAPLTQDEWTFIAVSFDGTSSGIYNSTAQAAATGGTDASNRANLQIFQGDNDAASVLTRTGVGYGESGANWQTNPGSVVLGSDASFYIGNILAETTIFVGEIADLRIYEGILSTSQINDIRVSHIPEASTFSMILILAILGLVAVRSRRN